MGTAVTLAGRDIGEAVADVFYERICDLEALLSRFRADSEVSRLANGDLELDQADVAVREVLNRCSVLRSRTKGNFEFEPRLRTGVPDAPVLDPDGFAKGWIIDEAALVLRIAGVREFFVNAGGDVVVERPDGAAPWRVGLQHPDVAGAVLGVFEIRSGAVATSGTYERGEHIRVAAAASLSSATVVGPDLAEADALATATFASGSPTPSWWPDVGPAYGLLTIDAESQLRWHPPLDTVEVRLCLDGCM